MDIKYEKKYMDRHKSCPYGNGIMHWWIGTLLFFFFGTVYQMTWCINILITVRCLISFRIEVHIGIMNNIQTEKA